MNLADYARKLVEGLVAGLNEGRYSLAVPVQRRETCVENSLEVL